MDILKEQLAEQTKYIDEIRSVKHDMQAHMFALYHYIVKNEYDKTKEYITKIMSIPILNNRATIDVGHDLVNTILSLRLRRSMAMIELETMGLIPEKMVMDDADLCVLFSNLISNSVEACEKLTYTDKIISIEIYQEQKNLIIIMKNPIEWELNPEILGKTTTKEDKNAHGYGIRNIQSIVDKYEGELSYQVDGGLVLVKITLRDIVKGNLIC